MAVGGDNSRTQMLHVKAASRLTPLGAISCLALVAGQLEDSWSVVVVHYGLQRSFLHEILQVKTKASRLLGLCCSLAGN